MVIRKLERHEILPALHLAWEVFAENIVPEDGREKVEAFQQFIKYDTIRQQVEGGVLTLFGAFDDAVLVGMGAVQNNGHITLLFVRKEHRNKGIEEGLRQHMKGNSKRHISKNEKAIVIIVAVAACFITAMFLFGRSGYLRGKTEVTMQNRMGIEEFFGEDGIFDRTPDVPNAPDAPDAPDAPNAPDAPGTEQPGGLEAIPEYVAEDLPYEVIEDSYTLEDEETKSTIIQFQVQYPQIKGLDGDVEEKVNKELKDCAMKTVDEVYLSPSEEMKEKVLKEQYPVLASFVEYKVSYMSGEFISVIYQDENYKGNQEEGQLSLRTKNINLKDGTAYEVKDIVTLDEKFIGEWIKEMRDEADDKQLLSELSESELKEVLSGDDKKGIYFDNFFVDADGVEIGLGLEYPVDSSDNRGFAWVTAPFDFEDIRAYKTDSKLWDLLSKENSDN